MLFGKDSQSTNAQLVKVYQLIFIPKQSCNRSISRVPDQSGVSQAWYIAEIHRSGWKPSIFELTHGFSGESIPIRLFLSGYELTPSMRDVNKKFSVRYYLNLVLVDEEDRRYFKQQVCILWQFIQWYFVTALHPLIFLASRDSILCRSWKTWKVTFEMKSSRPLKVEKYFFVYSHEKAKNSLKAIF